MPIAGLLPFRTFKPMDNIFGDAGPRTNVRTALPVVLSILMRKQC